MDKFLDVFGGILLTVSFAVVAILGVTYTNTKFDACRETGRSATACVFYTMGR